MNFTQVGQKMSGAQAEAHLRPDVKLGFHSLSLNKPSSFHTHLTAYEDGTECSETSAFKTQTPGNCPKAIIQHSIHGESLKSRDEKCLLRGTNWVFK